jgi:hypothetical protein|tara:strand:+ start:205 stop:393 length:189 start_codon:yes stop_codon:yes gene_type:complete
MTKIKFETLSPKMKNIMMTRWIKYYVSRGLELEDAQFAARWRSGTWKLSNRMRELMDSIDEL